MKIIRVDEDGFEIPQGGEVWKQMRVGMLTGTGICNIMPGVRGGVNKAYEDELDEIVTELLTGKPSGGFRATKYIKEGIEREPFARMFYEAVTGEIVEEVAFVKHDWMRVGMSPDGLVLGKKKNIEIKCPKDRTHLRYWLSDLCPVEYVIQIQSQLWLGELESCDFVSYHPDFPEDMQLRIINVKRDEAVIQSIADNVGKFLAEVNLKVNKVKALAESRKAVAA